MSSTSRPWYEKGIRFACQRSAKCCVNHGEYAYVYLEPDDVAKLASHLDLKKAEFKARYTERLKEGYLVLTSRGDECVFLEGHSCSVHEARPRQCASWPFWSITLDEQTWNSEVKSFCPGVGKGRLHSREEIEELADLNDDSHRR